MTCRSRSRVRGGTSTRSPATQPTTTGWTGWGCIIKSPRRAPGGPPATNRATGGGPGGGCFKESPRGAGGGGGVGGARAGGGGVGGGRVGVPRRRRNTGGA